jgi:hypothetical protein
LIDAVAVAIEPVQEGFRQLWPEAECTNILDDSLSVDRERDGVLTEAMKHRIRTLAEYGAATVSTRSCLPAPRSGKRLRLRRMPIPVLTPNEAILEAALAMGEALGMLAAFSPSVASMEDEFREMADAVGQRATNQTYCMMALWLS